MGRWSGQLAADRGLVSNDVAVGEGGRTEMRGQMALGGGRPVKRVAAAARWDATLGVGQPTDR